MYVWSNSSSSREQIDQANQLMPVRVNERFVYCSDYPARDQVTTNIQRNCARNNGNWSGIQQDSCSDKDSEEMDLMCTLLWVQGVDAGCPRLTTVSVDFSK
jgi:hypothetical protein